MLARKKFYRQSRIKTDEQVEFCNKFKEDLGNLFIRYWISLHVKNYSKKQTYVIIDGNRIEIYNETMFNMQEQFGHFKSYLIVRPMRWDL